MRISFTRTSPTHHRLHFEREDGSHESIELETKTFLFHDLLHFAAETEAGIQTGFWGSLAHGKTLSEMNAKSDVDMTSYKPETDLACMEIVVGALTGSWKRTSGGKTGGSLKEGLENIFGAYEKPLPTYVTGDYEERVLEKLRRLLGAWNSLTFGESLALEWKD